VAETAINPVLEQTIQDLVTLIDLDPTAYSTIYNRLLDQGLQQSRGYLSRESLVSLLDTIILPSNTQRDRGWQDTPMSPGSSTSGGTMNGVSTQTLESFFDLIFITTAFGSVAYEAHAINQFDWRTDESLKKHLLFSLCTSSRISSLFYLALACSSQAFYPVQIMTVDPCAGYLLAQWAFETNPQDGSFNATELSSVQTPTGAPSPFPSTYATSWTANSTAVVEGGGARFSANAIKVREQWIKSITTPVDSNPLGVWQQNWTDRLLSDSDSQLATLTQINSKFNLNEDGSYSRVDPNEDNNLKALGKTYQDTFSAAALVPEVDQAAVPTSNQTQGDGGAPSNLDQLLSLRNGEGGKVNTFGGSQLILNSDRIILNTRTDYLMLFGGAGVAISSPNPINVESDSTVTLYGEDGVFLGLPNKGEAIPSSTRDLEYEPMVLGSKLVDILEDLILTIRNSTILSSVGSAYFSEDTLHELAVLQARLPEIKSTFAYVDGVSHESSDPSPGPAPSSTPPPDERSATAVGEASAAPTTPLTDMDDFYQTNPLYNDPV